MLLSGFFSSKEGGSTSQLFREKFCQKKQVFLVQKCQIEPFFQATLWQKSSALEKERVGNERVEEEKIQEENVVDGEFGLWRGKKAKNGSNPGKLIVGMKERFLFSLLSTERLATTSTFIAPKKKPSTVK